MAFAYVSEDGLRWTANKMGNSRLVLDEFAWSDDQTIIAGHDMDMRSSPDLVTWTGSPGIGAGTYSYNDIAYGDGRRVTSVNGWGHVYTSEDGVTWTTVPGIERAGGFWVEYGGGVWLVAGGGSHFRSTNGVEFERVTPTGPARAAPGRFTGDRFVTYVVDWGSAAYADQLVYASQDGLTWSELGGTTVGLPENTAGVTYTLKDVAYGECKYVIAGTHMISVAGDGGAAITQRVAPFIAVGELPNE